MAGPGRSPREGSACASRRACERAERVPRGSGEGAAPPVAWAEGRGARRPWPRRRATSVSGVSARLGASSRRGPRGVAVCHWTQLGVGTWLEDVLQLEEVGPVLSSQLMLSRRAKQFSTFVTMSRVADLHEVNCFA